VKKPEKQIPNVASHSAFGPKVAEAIGKKALSSADFVV
jgi:hypothetical protein